MMSKYPGIKEYLKQNLLPFPADWPGWYYPKKLIANNCSGKYTSLIPEQGQFHVALNAVEYTVIIFKHFFDKLFYSFTLIWWNIAKEATAIPIITLCNCSFTWLDNGARQSLEKVHPLQEPRVCFHTLPVGRCDTVGILPVPDIQNGRFGILYVCDVIDGNTI